MAIRYNSGLLLFHPTLRCIGGLQLHQRLLKSNPKFDKVHFVTYREQRLIWEYLGDP